MKNCFLNLQSLSRWSIITLQSKCHFVIYLSFVYLLAVVVAGSAGVKAVLDRLNVVLVRHLQHGRRVSVGNWVRSVIRSVLPGVIDEKTFDTNLIREPKVRFYRHPGTIKSQASFEKLVEKKDEEKEEENGGSSDRPEIE